MGRKSKSLKVDDMSFKHHIDGATNRSSVSSTPHNGVVLGTHNCGPSKHSTCTTVSELGAFYIYAHEWTALRDLLCQLYLFYIDAANSNRSSKRFLEAIISESFETNKLFSHWDSYLDNLCDQNDKALAIAKIINTVIKRSNQSATRMTNCPTNQNSSPDSHQPTKLKNYCDGKQLSNVSECRETKSDCFQNTAHSEKLSTISPAPDDIVGPSQNQLVFLLQLQIREFVFYILRHLIALLNTEMTDVGLNSSSTSLSCDQIDEAGGDCGDRMRRNRREVRIACLIASHVMVYYTATRRACSLIAKFLTSIGCSHRFTSTWSIMNDHTFFAIIYQHEQFSQTLVSIFARMVFHCMDTDMFNTLVNSSLQMADIFNLSSGKQCDDSCYVTQCGSASENLICFYMAFFKRAHIAHSVWCVRVWPYLQRCSVSLPAADVRDLQNELTCRPEDSISDLLGQRLWCNLKLTESNRRLFNMFGEDQRVASVHELLNHYLLGQHDEKHDLCPTNCNQSMTLSANDNAQFDTRSQLCVCEQCGDNILSSNTVLPDVSSIDLVNKRTYIPSQTSIKDSTDAIETDLIGGSLNHVPFIFSNQDCLLPGCCNNIRSRLRRRLDEKRRLQYEQDVESSNNLGSSNKYMSYDFLREDFVTTKILQNHKIFRFSQFHQCYSVVNTSNCSISESENIKSSLYDNSTCIDAEHVVKSSNDTGHIKVTDQNKTVFSRIQCGHDVTSHSGSIKSSVTDISQRLNTMSTSTSTSGFPTSSNYIVTSAPSHIFIPRSQSLDINQICGQMTSDQTKMATTTSKKRSCRRSRRVSKRMFEMRNLQRTVEEFQLRNPELTITLVDSQNPHISAISSSTALLPTEYSPLDHKSRNTSMFQCRSTNPNADIYNPVFSFSTHVPFSTAPITSNVSIISVPSANTSVTHPFNNSAMFNNSSVITLNSNSFSHPYTNLTYGSQVNTTATLSNSGHKLNVSSEIIDPINVRCSDNIELRKLYNQQKNLAESDSPRADKSLANCRQLGEIINSRVKLADSHDKQDSKCDLADVSNGSSRMVTIRRVVEAGSKESKVTITMRGSKVDSTKQDNDEILLMTLVNGRCQTPPIDGSHTIQSSKVQVSKQLSKPSEYNCLHNKKTSTKINHAHLLSTNKRVSSQFVARTDKTKVNMSKNYVERPNKSFGNETEVCTLSVSRSTRRRQRKQERMRSARNMQEEKEILQIMGKKKRQIASVNVSKQSKEEATSSSYDVSNLSNVQSEGKSQLTESLEQTKFEQSGKSQIIGDCIQHNFQSCQNAMSNEISMSTSCVFSFVNSQMVHSSMVNRTQCLQKSQPVFSKQLTQNIFSGLSSVYKNDKIDDTSTLLSELRIGSANQTPIKTNLQCCTHVSSLPSDSLAQQSRVDDDIAYISRMYRIPPGISITRVKVNRDDAIGKKFSTNDVASGISKHLSLHNGCCHNNKEHTHTRLSASNQLSAQPNTSFDINFADQSIVHMPNYAAIDVLSNTVPATDTSHCNISNSNSLTNRAPEMSGKPSRRGRRGRKKKVIFDSAQNLHEIDSVFLPSVTTSRLFSSLNSSSSSTHTVSSASTRLSSSVLPSRCTSSALTVGQESVDREVEQFKQFCLDTSSQINSAHRRPKVNLNIDDLMTHMKLS